MRYFPVVDDPVGVFEVVGSVVEVALTSYFTTITCPPVRAARLRLDRVDRVAVMDDSERVVVGVVGIVDVVDWSPSPDVVVVLSTTGVRIVSLRGVRGGLGMGWTREVEVASTRFLALFLRPVVGLPDGLDLGGGDVDDEGGGEDAADDEIDVMGVSFGLPLLVGCVRPVLLLDIRGSSFVRELSWCTLDSVDDDDGGGFGVVIGCDRGCGEPRTPPLLVVVLVVVLAACFCRRATATWRGMAVGLFPRRMRLLRMHCRISFFTSARLPNSVFGMRDHGLRSLRSNAASAHALPTSS